MAEPKMKLTAHVMTGGVPEDWMTRLGVRAVKWHALFPGGPPSRPVLTIGRPVHYVGFSPNGNPEDAARWYAEHVIDPAIREAPWMEGWESPNEPEWDYGWAHERKVLAMGWYARYMARFAEEMHRRGKRAVIGNWSVGNPEFAYWPYYVKALAAVKPFNALLSRHSYGWLTEELALRHRKDNAEFAKLGFPDLPLAITECGAEEDHGMRPWKIEYGGDIRRYVNEWLIPFEREIRKDPYVLGATIFTVGALGSTRWELYDVGGTEIVSLLEPLAREPWASAPLPPTPPPPPVNPNLIRNGGFEEKPDGKGWEFYTGRTSAPGKQPIFRIERAENKASELSRREGGAGGQIVGTHLCYVAGVRQSLELPAGRYRISAQGRTWMRGDANFDLENDDGTDCKWLVRVTDAQGVLVTSATNLKGWQKLEGTFTARGGAVRVEIECDMGGPQNRWPMGISAFGFDAVVVTREGAVTPPPVAKPLFSYPHAGGNLMVYAAPDLTQVIGTRMYGPRTIEVWERRPALPAGEWWRILQDTTKTLWVRVGV